MHEHPIERTAVLASASDKAANAAAMSGDMGKVRWPHQRSEPADRARWQRSNSGAGWHHLGHCLAYPNAAMELAWTCWAHGGSVREELLVPA